MKSLRGKKVLITDDDSFNIFALSAALSQYELNIVTASSGQETLEILRQQNDFDIILMDIMMPEMDGYEVMTRLRQDPLFKTIPIIALTAKAMAGDDQKCIEAGASDYLPKPIDVSRLVNKMDDLLSKHTSSGTL